MTLPPWPLRPYQVEAVRAVSRAWQDNDRTMLVCATGTGKTRVLVDILRRRHMAGRGRALVIAHRIELLTQAQRQIREAGLSADIESGDSLAPTHTVMGGGDVVVATVQTLRGRRLERWSPDAFDTLVIDEAHHATAASYRAVLDRFPRAKILGVTATPDRGDGVALGGVIDHLAYEYDLRTAIEEGYLCPLRILAIDTPSIDLSTVRTTKQEHGRDLSAGDLAKQMAGEAQLHELAGPIAKESGDRPTIVFVPSVEIAHELARVLGAYVGIGNAVALDGQSPADQRADVLDRYKRGEIRILVNCALFTEGFDAPNTACVAVARPTKSRALYAQMVGRGTRLVDGKKDCLILDLAPSNARHSLVSPVDLMAGKDLPEDLLKSAREAMSGDDCLEVLRRSEKMAQERAERQERDLRQSYLAAEVRYRKRARDPFDELGIDGEVGTDRGPRATSPMLAAIERAGFSLGKMPSIKEASRILDELAGRRKAGLCTIKQMRLCTGKGLRSDLTFAEAGEAITALKANDWRVSPEIAERWGA